MNQMQQYTSNVQMNLSAFISYIFRFFAFLFSVYGVAQSESVYIDGPYYVHNGQEEQWYGNVTLGPNAELYIEDDAKILFYGLSFKMEPGAKIYGANKSWTHYTQGSGTGSIVFQQPNPINGYTAQQILDGGNQGSAIDSNVFSNIEINNPKGIMLKNTNVAVGNSILFISGNLFLDNNDLIMSQTAVLKGYDASKFVVTNGSGHLVKENYTGIFEFPIGIAANNYTPASVELQANNTIHINVTNYAHSAAIETDANGIDRTWNIYADTAAGAEITLQHNSSTNGSDFNSNANYVSQYGIPDLSGKIGWQINNDATPSKIFGVAETNSATFSSLPINPLDEKSYFTKLSKETESHSNPLAISISKEDVMCDVKGSATAMVSGGKEPYLYNWNNGAKTQKIDNLEKGTYDVIVSDIDGKTITANIVIDETAAPNPGIISGDENICLNETTQLATDGIQGGIWTSSDILIAEVEASTGEVSGKSRGLATITYTVSNDQGCTSKVSYQVIVEDCKSVAKDDIEVFNVITPNEDGANDQLIIKGLENYASNKLEIFDRWGIKVFATENYGKNDNYFRGISNGKAVINQSAGLPRGTYFYVLVYTDFEGNQKEKVGYLYLMR